MMNDDWIECELGEIITVSSGKGLTSKEMIGTDFPVYGGNGINGFHNEYLFEEEKLIIGRVGVKCGVTHITKNKSWITDNALIVHFKDEKYILKYFKLLLESENLNKLSNSTAQPVISGSKIYSYSIPLAPLPIQRAIVSKIEALFSDLENGIANFKKAQAQLKIYRQAVLKKAFEGKLSELGKKGFENDEIIDEQKEEILQSNNPRNPNSEKREDNLPKGWKWVKLGEVGKIKGGKRLPPKHSYAEQNTDYLYIMAGNLKDGTVKHKQTFINKDTYDILSNYKVVGGEVYITIVGACIGDAGIIPKSIGNAILTENAAKIIDLKSIDNKYLALWINSIDCQTEIKKNILSATLGKLALSRIATLSVPLPPTTEEQTQIVQEIERRLSVCDKMEQSIIESIAKAEALRQSILKKAFEGKLLSQTEIDLCKKEADYEPAGELLKKIKAGKLAKEQQQQNPILKKKSKQ